MNKRKVVISLIIIVVAILLISGVSFAYFQLNIKGEDAGITGYTGSVFPQSADGPTIKNYYLSGIEVSLETKENGFINSSSINLIKQHEISNKAEKSHFIVVNRDYNNQVKYSVSLAELAISPNLQDEDFKWQLVKFGTDSEIASGNFQNAKEDVLKITDEIILNPRTAHEYELRLWIEETEKIQNHLLEGSFDGKISISVSVVNGHLK